MELLNRQLCSLTDNRTHGNKDSKDPRRALLVVPRLRWG